FNRDPLVFLGVTKMVGVHVLFSSLVERCGDYNSINRLIANHDLDGLPGFGGIHGQHAQPDILSSRRGWTAAGHPSGRIAIDEHFVAIAADAAAGHFKTYQRARYAFGLLLFE